MNGNVVPFVLGIVLAVIALLFRCGKCLFLLAGYNTLPKEEKK